MSLMFLYPLAWLGALAVGVPIWLHLRRREEQYLVRFSAMQFLDHEPLARSRPLWPRDWPLLLLRLAGLMLLVAAFTWPYVQTPPESAVQEDCVYLLDNTLSVQAAGGFEKGRKQVLEALRKADEEKRTAVVELTGAPRVVAGLDDDQDATTEKLQALQPSFQRGSYLAAFRMAAGLLTPSPGVRKKIVLVADSQENQWSEGQHSLPFLENIEVVLPEVPLPSNANVALMDPTARRVIIDDRMIVECTVRLYHHQGPAAATVVFRADGKDVARQTVPLKGRPALLTLSAQWETQSDRAIRGEVRLEGATDALPADDAVVFAVPAVHEGRVALLARSPFLRTALSPAVMRGRWKTRVLGLSDLGALAKSGIDDDVLFLESSFLASPEGRDLAMASLDRAKGVVLAVDRATPVVSAFLRRFDVELISEVASAAGQSALRYVCMEDPIFQPFRSADFGDLTQIEVKRYRRLKTSDAVPLAFSAAGDPVLFRCDKGKGRLLLLAFSLDRSETNWPVHPTFVPFLDRCLEDAQARRAAQTVYRPGEPVVWQVPPDGKAEEVVLRVDAVARGASFQLANRPGSNPSHNAAGDIVARAAVADGQARLRAPDLPGLYALSYDNRQEPEALLAVNPAPEESCLTYAASPETLADWLNLSSLPPGEGQGVRGVLHAGMPEAALDISRLEILRQRIWWWLLLGGLAALGMETMWLSLRKASP